MLTFVRNHIGSESARSVGLFAFDKTGLGSNPRQYTHYLII